MSASRVALGLFTAGLMPIILGILCALGLPKVEPESQISKIWMRTDSSFANDMDYAEEFSTGSRSNSMILTIAKPRGGGNVMRADLLMLMRERLKETQSLNITVNGNEFTYDDVCVNLVEPYSFPCYRITMLDCFKQGDYDFSSRNTAAFGALLIGSVQGQVDSQIDGSIKPALTRMGIASSILCNTSCTVDGVAQVIGPLAASFGMPAGTWENDPTCKICLDTWMVGLPQTGNPSKDMIYYLTLEELWGTVGVQPNGDPAPPVTFLQAMYGVATKEEALDLVLVDTLKKALNIDSAIKSLEGKTPYTYQLGENLQPQGASRPSLENPDGTFMSEADVLNVSSKTCYAWDEGQAIPPVSPFLTLGPVPTKYPIEKVEALQNVHLFSSYQDIRERVGSPTAAASRPGGAVDITVEDAKEVLFQFKKQMEEIFSRDWSDDASNLLEFTAWTDDSSVGGSTFRMLDDVTLKSVKQAVICFVIVCLISAVFFIDIGQPLLQSRAILAFVGALLVVLGVVATFALLALCGEHLNIATSYTMPFIMVGILCDDVYMLILAAGTVASSADVEKQFMMALKSVGVPITVTSAVNFGVFLTLRVCSDLPAITGIGNSGMIATATLYFTVIISGSAMVYLDMKRRASGRMELLCCFKAPAKEVEKRDSRLFSSVYWPALQHRVGRGVILAVAVGLVAFGCISLKDIDVGLDLQDLYPDGVQSQAFIANRMAYFPVWPIQVYWGELDYLDPATQMKMARQWEDVSSTSHVAPGIPTSLVWTAAFAEWGVPSQYNVGPCNKDNAYTNGNCAETVHRDLGGIACQATFMPNTMGLKLKAEGGICHKTADLNLHGSHEADSVCPVMQLNSNAELAQCFARWKNATRQVTLVSPGLAYEADDLTPTMPIKLSTAGGNSMYAYNLFTTANYMDLLKDTRRFTDDDDSVHAWMNGIAYDYWEQYLTIESFMWSIGSWSTVAALVVSFLFLVIAVSARGLGNVPQRLVSCCVGALLISAVVAASMLTVWGITTAAGIQLSGFTAVSVLFATGFAVEYAVHVVHHFLVSGADDAIGRVGDAMGFLFLPMIMAFWSSVCSIIVLAFSDFTFVKKFFFTPLLIVVLVTFFYGAFALPALLGSLGCMPSLRSEAESETPKLQETEL